MFGEFENFDDFEKEIIISPEFRMFLYDFLKDKL